MLLKNHDGHRRALGKVRENVFPDQFIIKRDQLTSFGIEFDILIEMSDNTTSLNILPLCVSPFVCVSLFIPISARTRIDILDITSIYRTIPEKNIDRGETEACISQNILVCGQKCTVLAFDYLIVSKFKG